MRDALNATGRPIFYSLCNWGDEKTWQWARNVGNSYRISGDIADRWESIEMNMLSRGSHASSAGPGGWNDPDMLEIGNGALTIEEERTHFAMWAILKAPLIIGADLSKISPESLEILKTKQIIEVNQDPLGQQGVCVKHCHGWAKFWRRPMLWTMPMSNGDIVVVALNYRATNYSNFKFHFAEAGVAAGKDQHIKVVDLWTQKVVGENFEGA